MSCLRLELIQAPNHRIPRPDRNIVEITLSSDINYKIARIKNTIVSLPIRFRVYSTCLIRYYLQVLGLLEIELEHSQAYLVYSVEYVSGLCNFYMIRVAF